MIEADPVASAVRGLMSGRTVWTGTASALLNALGQEVSEAGRRERTWPTSPRALSGRLRRAATSLRKVGVEITFSQEGRARTRTIRITAVSDSAGAQPSAPSAPSAAEPKPNRSNGLAAHPMRTVGHHADGRADGRGPRTGPTVCAKPLSLNVENAADDADANCPDLSASRKDAAPAWRARL